MSRKVQSSGKYSSSLQGKLEESKNGMGVGRYRRVGNSGSIMCCIDDTDGVGSSGKGKSLKKTFRYTIVDEPYNGV